MAITAATIWELQTGGNDANGGGFDSTIAGAGTDYSQGTTQQATLTTASVVGATTTDITVAAGDYTVASTDVGNIVFITGGTATAGFYQIVTATTGASQKWTMDRSLGTAGQTCPGRMGGCRKLLSANSFFSSIVAGNIVYVKAGSYTMGGSMSSFTTATAALPIIIEGYNATRGDAPTVSSGNQPIITAGGVNTIQFTAFNFVRYISFVPGATNGVRANTGPVTFLECKSSTTGSQNAFTFSGASIAFHCEAKSTLGTGFLMSGSGSSVIDCYIHDSTDGIEVDTGMLGGFIVNNLIVNCSGTSIKFFSSGQKAFLVANNTLYGAATPAGTGISAADTVSAGAIFLNNIIYGFTTGVSWSTATTSNLWAYNTFFNNTTNRTNVTAGATDIALDPTFTSVGTGDYSVGSNMKAAGFPGTYAGLSTTTNYIDIGAIQRQEPASTGGFAPTIME